ncbi:uncharacterized protein LOC115726374 [Rhodamnia argentea]|uniref:Uncharacterized protein LOC115726374 n=1 Tax=Rhodamnia argentea TaxID=178133 RepID=A0ABM3HA42_9MYRT|nr:uncharacterized protein LOC115726374 [Rhodamnia argentea]
MSTHSSPFPSCFRPSSAGAEAVAPPTLPPPPPLPPGNDNANLTTCLYHTHLGLFSLTWSKTLFGRSLHLSLHSHHGSGFLDYSSSPLSPSSSTFSFHLHIKPLVFWKKQGSKKLDADKTGTSSSVRIFWDLARAKFGPGPEPESGFYIAVVVGGEMALLVGDAAKSAYSKTKARKCPGEGGQALFLRREHVFGHRVYATSARFGGKNRAISIDCNVHSEGKLCISVDKRRVLQVKRLKWKFRGNERVEVDGVNFQVSWDVYNWLFEDASDSHAVFMFRFEKPFNNNEEREGGGGDDGGSGSGGVNAVSDLLLWSQPSCSFGMNEIELRKMRKSRLRSARSFSSSSISSSASSGGSSSVMEWASAEENELSGPFVGFSLLVYAWKR